MEDVRACNGCNYKNTPKDRDTCNFCGERFSVTDNKKPDVSKKGFGGLAVKDIKTTQKDFPSGWENTKDTRDFVKALQGTPVEPNATIYKIQANAGNFYCIMSGCTFQGLTTFLESHKHLKLFNVYCDQLIPNLTNRNPPGTIGIAFESNKTTT